MQNVQQATTPHTRVLRRRRALQERLEHRRPKLRRVLKPGLKELARLHKPVLIKLEAAERDALAPAPRSDDELEVIRTVGRVVQRRVYSVVKARLRAEEVLRHAEEHPEERRRGEVEVHKRLDAERGPAVDHCEQRQVRVREMGVRRRVPVLGDVLPSGGGGRAAPVPPQAEAVEDVLAEQDRGARRDGAITRLGAEDFVACVVDAAAHARVVAHDHELVDLGGAPRVLVDLDLCGRVQDR